MADRLERKEASVASTGDTFEQKQAEGYYGGQTALNLLLLVSHAVMEGKGEDAYVYSFEDVNAVPYGMIGVLDGCGGLGARQYPSCEGHTGAYIAARVAAAACHEWFRESMPNGQEGMYRDEAKSAASLKERVDGDLEQAWAYLGGEKAKIRGDMIRVLPTTASLAVVDYTDPGSMNCLFLWAGDSRGYVLQADGLKQCTRDDLRAYSDAFENLYADSPLSNMIHAEKDYRINTARVACRKPTIVITATDGVFGYLPSPMHLEYLLLDTMLRAEDPEQWQKLLAEQLGKTAADDCTLMLSALGWKSFADMQESFRPRAAVLRELLQDAGDVDALRAIWQEYQVNYNLVKEAGR